jgi:hypothetical protein
MSAQSPVGTTLAILERVLKVMSAVQARIHYTMKQEFKLLRDIIRDNTPDSYSYQPEVGNKKAKQSDYDMCSVLPVSDPNASTMSQRVVQFQAVLQLASGAPQIYDLPYLHRQMIETLGVKNASKIVPLVEDMKPVDPVSENMAIMNGKPVKAFFIQDHEAHLAVHIAAVKDPKIAAIMGQNPKAQAIMASAQAHIMEHVAFQYRKEIEKMLGAALPPMKEEGDEDRVLPPDLEVQLAQLSAQAAAKLLQKDTAEMQAQQAQQQAQDPLVQMQQQELQIKMQEVQRKQKKDIMDAAAKADELKLKEEALRAKQETDGTKLGIQAAKDKETARREDEKEGMRIGVDIAKQKLQLAHQASMKKPQESEQQ